MHTTATTRPGGVARSQLLVVIAAASLALFTTLVQTLPVGAQEELTLEKYVAAVNETAPAEPISVSEGDTISYGLAVSSSAALAGTTVTVTDVFGANQLDFQNASVGGCVDDGNQVTCTLALDEAGGAEVTLTFVVLPLEGSSDGCRTLTNTARVDSAEGATATSQTQIDVCAGSSTSAAAGGAAAAPPAGSAGGTGAVAGGTGVPASVGSEGQTTADTAVAPQTGLGSAVLIQLGALLLGTGAVALAHAPARRRR